MASTTSTNGDTEPQTSASPTPTITSSSMDPIPSKIYTKLSLDKQWHEDSDSWKYADTVDPDLPAEQVQPMDAEGTVNNDSWKEYCFVVVRKHSKPSKDSSQIITFKIFLMSQYIIKACQNVMADLRGVSWKSEPIKLDPQTLIAYFPRLEKYERNLAARTDRTEEDNHILNSLGVLLAHMRKHYRKTLERIATLIRNHEITYDLLYAILLPGVVIIRHCPITGEPRALKLLATTERCRGEEIYCYLICEYLEVATDEEGHSWEEVGREDKANRKFGMCRTSARIDQFDGVEKINSLSAYPIVFHENTTGVADELLTRARKWVSLSGVHHMEYQGNAGRCEGENFRRYSIRSRIMVDKTNFSRVNADYCLPQPQRILSGDAESEVYGLTAQDLILAPTIVYGFSLADKLWLEFNVNHVVPIVWNDEAFDSLVLAHERKELLRGLIVAHSNLHTEGPTGFDDFVRGKGRGLVINLFGPPGVGKTLSAEATSEHLRRPLYVVGSGDLGTSASELDYSLRRAFDLAATWRAVLLIDEADVFLEERSLRDLERNAMVAVFLRQLEYYQGILFMTTNRIRTFDEAFLSRIHVSLHFDELDVPTKVKIWRAFLEKAGLKDAEDGLLLKLATQDINGRQIKNTCSTAMSLAASRDEKMGYEHLELVLAATEDFMKYFKPEQKVTDLPPEIEEDTIRVWPVPWWGKRLVNRINEYLTCMFA